MPQITVDYSEQLADGFDRTAFARELHGAVGEIASASPSSCKTRFRRIEEAVAGTDTEGHAVVHVQIGLFPGRTEETKARLTGTALELLRRHLEQPDGLTLHASAEIREMEAASYRKYDSA
ncbi:isomerase [Streptomyces sp. SBST2-5]|uniref:Isomerase n=1 Tax=Streptomyces composti TaxID=2720025 RepID=A0ABX1A4S0_9ACTN|nr:isomerase [Streptomyces composti]NJP51438.1 isomerase [Streptomyces composti]